VADREPDDEPSQTALTAAAARAAHLIVDEPPAIFSDTFASTLLGDHAEEFISYHRAHGTHPILSTARGQVVCRSRYAEDCLAEAVARGTSQYVILGAGLDSFAYRSELATRVITFELDRPATQRWKREILAAAGIRLPDALRFVPAEFEQPGALIDGLAENGFDLTKPAFVSWLGVTMYLTAHAIGAALADLGSLEPGTELVADHMLPPDQRDEAGNGYAEQVAAVAAQRGEPWLTVLGPADMAALLAGHGFAVIRHVAQHEVGDAATWQRTDSIRPVRLSLLTHAVVAAKPPVSAAP
jgi:methyltransferase (TIGR00027 family)